MTQNGLLATRSPSDNMKVVYLEAEEKGCKKKRKRTKQQSPAQSARHKCCACDGRHRGRDERHALHTPVTDVTHGVTNVTPFPYFLGADNASET